MANSDNFTWTDGSDWVWTDGISAITTGDVVSAPTVVIADEFMVERLMASEAMVERVISDNFTVVAG